MSSGLSREDFEKASDEIHLEIGRAISEWSVVEQWLFDVFARLVSIGGAIPAGLSSSFDEVRSFDTRLSMVTALIEHSGFPPDARQQHMANWKPVRNKLKKLSEKRNSLAHGSIISPQRVLVGPPVAKPVWVPYYEAKGYHLFKLASPQVGAPYFTELTAADIVAIRKSFIDGQKALAEFYRVHFQ